MMVYVFGFVASCFLFYLSSKASNKVLRIILTIFALLIPCLIAGLRDLSVGTDVEVYLTRLFDRALNSGSLSDYLESGWNVGWRIKHVYEYEMGFSLLVFLIAKAFGNIHIVLFAIQAITILPFYFGIKCFKPMNNKIWLGMLVYYTLFFCASLNTMRQMIGVSIVFLAISLLLNKKKSDFGCIAMFVVAMLFHKSSVLGLIIYLLYKTTIGKDGTQKRLKFGKSTINLSIVIMVVVVIISVYLLFNSALLSKITSALGFDSYTGYLADEVRVSFGQQLIRLPALAFVLLNAKRISKNDEANIILLYLAIVDILFANLSTASMYASRICILFHAFYIASLPRSLLAMPKKYKQISKIMIIAYLFAYWYVVYADLGSGHTVPYVYARQ